MKILQKTKKTVEVKFINKKKAKKLKDKVAKNNGFKGNNGEIIISKKVIYVGIHGIKTRNDWRELGFKLSKALSGKIKEITIEVPENSQDFIEGLYLGVYKTKDFKSNNISKNILKRVYLKSKKNIKQKIKQAKIKTEAQKLTRYLVNTPPNILYSETILKEVKEIFRNHKNIKITEYNEKKLENFGMEGHLAVNRASKHQAMTIKIEYTPKNKNKDEKAIILVGKGLTFDSGGLNVKPGMHMETMKADKAGAMTVIGIMKGISKLNINKKVVAYLGIAENMISEDSYRPDDILTMKNGKTVHVKNTDAEGRIVLFDNLCLAEEENKKIDKIFTFATLTGAAIFQFGDEATAMVGFNDKIKKEIKKIGEEEGEIFMNAEFHKYMLKGVEDDFADLSNTGTQNMGCQKAGIFLSNALTEKTKKKYLHLDIAGPAFVKAPFGVNEKGGTGETVRTFIEYLKQNEK